MSWLITLVVGFLIGIMFSIAFPEPAMNINNMIFPAVETVTDAGKDIVIDSIKESVKP